MTAVTLLEGQLQCYRQGCLGTWAGWHRMTHASWPDFIHALFLEAMQIVQGISKPNEVTRSCSHTRIMFRGISLALTQQRAPAIQLTMDVCTQGLVVKYTLSRILVTFHAGSRL